jgi:5-formyltetrahydrofolate cyclo-ligase
MVLNIDKEKNKIRKEMRGRSNRMKAIEKDIADLAICETVSKLSEIKNAETIAVYAAIGHEVDLNRFIFEAIKKGKRICYPRFIIKAENVHEYEMAEIMNKNDLVIGRFNILEPGIECPVCALEEIDAWLVPGVSFDITGTRLGRGGGVYDRLLKNVTDTKIGVLYQAQMRDFLPCEKHDRKMDMLITEKGIIQL